MKVDVYWVKASGKGHLAIMPRPRSGDWLQEELEGWAAAGVNTVVSLLTSVEVMELALQNEPQICQGLGVEFISYPINDRQVPTSAAATLTVAQNIASALNDGKNVAIH